MSTIAYLSRFRSEGLDALVLGFRPVTEALGRHRVAAAVCVVGYLLAAFLFDWWGLNGTAAWRPLLTVRIFGAVSFALIACFLLELVRRVRTSTRLVMLAWALYSGILLSIVWPGLLTPDTRALYMRSFDYPLDDWFGIFTSLQYSSSLQLIPHVGFYAIHQLMSWCAVMGLADHVLRSAGARAWLRIAVNVWLATSVAGMYGILQLSRDTSFAIAFLAMLTFVARIFFLRDRVTLTALIGGAVSAAVLCAIRFDSIVIVVAAALILLFWSQVQRRMLVSAGLVFVVFYMAFVPISGTLVGRASQTMGYGMTLIINPLGYIINSDFRSSSRAQDLEVIDKVVSVDVIRKVQQPDEIAAYWAGAVRWDSTVQERKEFILVFARLVLTNFDRFLEGRVLTFLGSTGLRERNGAYVHKEYTQDSGDGKDMSGFVANPPFPDARHSLLEMVKTSAEFRGLSLSGSAVYFNFLPHIVVCLALLCFFRQAPASASIAALLLIKVAINFVFAPASQHLYFLCLVISVPFALAIFVLEMCRPSKNSAAPVAGS